MYTCGYDDDLAEIVKREAVRSDRTVKGQFTYFLKKALREEGLLPSENKKADHPPRQSACNASNA
ncbi:hypothetical protein [Acinetobacter puyangensis]|uniref:hypothetical protein n=1 Tax=Acinetobacter puyangensis TaxID=1096779 RepID=UPI003A4D4D8A